jgi:hypothetical protein
MFAQRLDEHEEAVPGFRERWIAFERRLLVHGGNAAVILPCATPVEDLDLYAEIGEYHDGSAARLERGEPNGCHQNAARLVLSGRVAALGTGYALSDDELWREHSWGVHKDGTIVETTEMRVAYFGVTADGEPGRILAESFL